MATSLAGYLAFLRDGVGIPVSALPDDSLWIELTYNAAREVVLTVLCGIAPNLYELCVYNFATDMLINIAPDQPGSTYFKDARASFDINTFVAGVVQNTHDENTGEGMTIPNFYNNMSLADMALLKTPWGRFYFSIAQKFGTLWGIS